MHTIILVPISDGPAGLWAAFSKIPSRQSCGQVFVPPFEMRDMNNAQSEGLGNEPWSVAVGDNGQEFGDTEKKAGGGEIQQTF